MRTIPDHNTEQALQAQVAQALSEQTPLRIIGNNSKAFYGFPGTANQELSCREHTGIIAYEPTELAITVRSGTSLADVEALLLSEEQQLTFEPPNFSGNATMGGVTGAGLSGPRRPSAGSVRDALLGVKIINGKGHILEFGGRVMKNVAGYDHSRLMAGSMGTLGLLLEVTYKVKPRPKLRTTIRHQVTQSEALRLMRDWGRLPLAITATAYDGENLFARVCGAEDSLKHAIEVLAGEDIGLKRDFWLSIKNQQHPFFLTQQQTPELRLWRLSLPPATPWLDLPGKQFIEWGGALRWLLSAAPGELIHTSAHRAQGHAMCFRGHDSHQPPFPALDAGLAKLHRQLKQELDPQGIFNPGRLYPEF